MSEQADLMEASTQALTSTLKKTPLHDLHLAMGAKMVEFAGYEMPVQYPAGVKAEHLHTREAVGLFDVSHMGQITVSGKQIAQALEKLIPVDIEALAINQQSYGLLTSDSGGILDDLIITRWADDLFFIVINAACKDADIAHLQAHLPQGSLQTLDDRALLALQGPKAKEVMAQLAPQACELIFMHGCFASIDCGDISIDCYMTRSGYTGEDGFEISVSAKYATLVANTLLGFGDVGAIGLGARDSLRLEAGLCLYGHDMTPSTNPIEASLLWSISPSRRATGDKAGGFLGAESIFTAQQAGITRKRVGLLVNGRAPIREGVTLVDSNGEHVGEVTSGGFGPSLNAPVAMGYVNKTHADIGTTLFAQVRGKQLEVTVSKMPFVQQRYYRG